MGQAKANGTGTDGEARSLLLQSPAETSNPNMQETIVVNKIC